MLSLLDAATTRTTLCCVNPTSKLLDGLTGHLDQASGTLLSIGSGSGLFERLLAYRFPSLSVIGVDVAPVDVFLGDAFKLVREGSCPVVLNVSVLLAVYLRRPSILISYLEWFPDVHTIILLGPRSEDPLADHDVADALRLHVGHGLHHHDSIQSARHLALAKIKVDIVDTHLALDKPV
ncbi:hypothetical protein AC1031_020487 [Aphanomyces cochlioides]|nr:hypothetical protein AC1031_020487 [Aphanomyces cochlioides]